MVGRPYRLCGHQRRTLPIKISKKKREKASAMYWPRRRGKVQETTCNELCSLHVLFGIATPPVDYVYTYGNSHFVFFGDEIGGVPKQAAL